MAKFAQTIEAELANGRASSLITIWDAFGGWFAIDDPEEGQAVTMNVPECRAVQERIRQFLEAQAGMDIDAD